MDQVLKTADILEQAIAQVIHLLRHNNELLAGSLYVSKTRCGRQNCKCMSSEYRHENLCFSFTDAGRSRTRTVPRDLADKVQCRTEAYRAVKAQRRHISHQMKALIQEFDCLIRKAAEKGAEQIIPVLSKNRRNT